MKVHFTGIKGVGMMALALAYQEAGWEVQGSDTKDFQITDEQLKARGIKVFEKFSPRNIWELKKMVWVPAIDKLIYTGAHHGAQNVEVKWAASRGVPTMNYAKALGEFFADKKQICVCGVGGKTTTTAMIATILNEAGLDPSWIIGTSQIASLPVSGRWGKGDWAVIEGDEYAADPVADKTPKFMYLTPKVIICTNIHHDHPDVYPKEEDAVEAYMNFFDKLPKDGLLLLSSQANGKLVKFRKLHKQQKVCEIKVFDDDPVLKKMVQEKIAVPGDYNIGNAMAAVLSAESVGISRGKALTALKKFIGLKRRFEFIGVAGGTLIYDDYAHHPHEISVLFAAARQKFPDKKIKFVFQPHTFSRTKALFDQFADSLKDVDEVILDPIFASARETVDVEISSEMLAKKINEKGGNAVFITNRRKLVEYLIRTSEPEEVIFTIGAGNLYEIHSELKQSLGKKG